MGKLRVLIMFFALPIGAHAQVFDGLVGHKICWSNGRTALFLSNGDFFEDGKKAGSWAHLAGDTIDWSSDRTGRGAVEFAREGSAIVVKWAGRSLAGKLCK